MDRVLDNGILNKESQCTTGQLSGMGQTGDVSGLKQNLAHVGEAASDAVSTASRKITGYGHNLLNEQKERLVTGLGSFSSAFHQVADRLQAESEDNPLASYAHTIGEQIERASGYLSDKRVEDLVDDVRSAVRRRPEIALAGLFVVGLGVARLVKAAAPTLSGTGRGRSGIDMTSDVHAGYGQSSSSDLRPLGGFNRTLNDSRGGIETPRMSPPSTVGSSTSTVQSGSQGDRSSFRPLDDESAVTGAFGSGSGVGGSGIGGTTTRPPNVREPSPNLARDPNLGHESGLKSPATPSSNVEVH